MDVIRRHASWLRARVVRGNQTTASEETTMQIPENTLTLPAELDELMDILGGVPRSAFNTSSVNPYLAFTNEDDDDDDDNDDDSSKSKSKSKPKGKRISEEEFNELKRLRDKEKKGKDDKRKQEGKYDEIISEKDEEIETAKKEGGEWKSKYEKLVAKSSVVTIARRLGMKDPEDDAMRYLDDDVLVLDDNEEIDEKLVESALKKLRKRKGHLFGDPPRTGGGHGGNNGGSNGKRLLTHEEISKMSTSDIQKNQKLVDESMAALGQD